jgi:hypothetical protein
MEAGRALVTAGGAQVRCLAAPGGDRRGRERRGDTFRMDSIATGKGGILARMTIRLRVLVIGYGYEDDFLLVGDTYT